MSQRILIRNCMIYDGAGSEPVSGDILIENDRIKAVGTLDAVEAEKLIDGTGLAASPGFIDTHTHSDGKSHYHN